MMMKRKNKNKIVRKMHRMRNKMMQIRTTKRIVKRNLSLMKKRTTESYIDTPLNPIIIDNLSKIA